MISLLATGGVFSTVIVTRAVSVLPNSSMMLYGNVTTQANPVSGTNVVIPAGLIFTIQPVTGILCAIPGVRVMPLILVIVRSSPSGFTSLLSRLITTGVFVCVV